MRACRRSRRGRKQGAVPRLWTHALLPLLCLPTPHPITTDGRDVNDDTALPWVQRLAGDAKQLSERHGADVCIASGGGRMGVTMDRCERRLLSWALCKWAHEAGGGPWTCLASTEPTSSRSAHAPTYPTHPPTLPPSRADESDWSVVQRGYSAHVLGEAPHTFADPVEAVRALKKGNSVSGGRVGGRVGLPGCRRVGAGVGGGERC